MAFPRRDCTGTAPFHYMVRASGQGEVWQGEDCKFNQYGWRCNNGEDSYSTGTLIGNWCEERFDIRRVSQRRSLPSQFAHYFETTYSSTYSRDKKHPLRASGFKREARSFPGHLPELDPPQAQCVPYSCYRADFKDHMTLKDRCDAGSLTQADPRTHLVGHAKGPPKSVLSTHLS